MNLYSDFMALLNVLLLSLNAPCERERAHGTGMAVFRALELCFILCLWLMLIAPFGSLALHKEATISFLE